ncbi:MAG: YihY/virulence factor BrkB family protein [Thermoanaerobaculum sp.]|nr:YihY/virulence factor BrkB family protein [Thermoanaerobaculum sp.]MCX7894980.1 YihY/virulence factor BrkB family protein [Thermoanaerobaculum sp.]MDW7967546.1 YhjD/YihY/BrkB family envelope integrity protein [Thermoanaerobaculum sp.]
MARKRGTVTSPRATLNLLLAELRRRLSQHSLPLHAAALAYTTLLSLVPLFSVVFVVTSQVDLAKAEQVLTQLAQLLPFSPQQLQGTLATLTRKTAALGLLGLAFSLLAALNALWQVDVVLAVMAGGRRRRWLRLTSFLTLLLVGPLLLAALLTLSSLLPGQGTGLFWRVLPWLARHGAGLFVLCLVYKLVPPRKPPWSAALLGASVATLLLSGISRSVVVYWRLLPQLDLIYGPLSLLLLFLMSLMLSWLAFLFGAELAFAFSAVASSRR